jgi:hypothetical protein
MHIGRIWPGVSLALAALLLLGGPPSFAQQRPTQAQSNAIRQSCRADYEANCASVPTGGMASLQCLQQHYSQLSQPCAKAVGATMGSSQTAPPATRSQTQGAPARDEAQIVREHCAADYRSLCRGVRPGGGRALACLEENQSRLSPGCQSALAGARAAHR